VIKIGSSLLFSDKGQEYFCSFLNSLGDQVRTLWDEKNEIVLVSSGAIAFGIHELGLKQRPKELYLLQSAAAIGQNRLMDYYRKFLKTKVHVAQILLTWEDFTDKRRYTNTKNTLLSLLKLGSIPIINENDTVSTDEIRFGDNDRLSALVASLVSADLLIILSDVDGLLDREKKVVRVVPEITSQIKELACPTLKKTCVGGMITKIEAAKIAVDSGIPCVIANGRNPDIILRILKESDLMGNWTLFLPKKGYLAARKRWIAFSAKPKGKIFVDEGAKKALLNKKSLLSVGVTGVEGNFESLDIVSIVDAQGNEFARGKTCISCAQLDKVKGMRFEKEIVHCDNIVVFI
jgi:glutamate 5-kinase